MLAIKITQVEGIVHGDDVSWMEVIENILDWSPVGLEDDEDE